MTTNKLWRKYKGNALVIAGRFIKYHEPLIHLVVFSWLDYAPMHGNYSLILAIYLDILNNWPCAWSTKATMLSSKVVNEIWDGFVVFLSLLINFVSSSKHKQVKKTHFNFYFFSLMWYRFLDMLNLFIQSEIQFKQINR